MINFIFFIFKSIYFVKDKFFALLTTFFSSLILRVNKVSVPRGFVSNGVIRVIRTSRGQIFLGENLTINSGDNYNIIGRQQRTVFWVEGRLEIGNNVGLSSCVIICQQGVKIGDNVKIGGNVVIYDTDFHSLDPIIRANSLLDQQYASKKRVEICEGAFIGAHSTVLKGVTIGERSIVGACSVVSKNIPPGEIWAGNPIRFVRKIEIF